MRRGRSNPLFLAACLAATACNVAHGDSAAHKEQEQAVLAKRALRTQEALARTDSGAPNPEPVARWLLPKSLRKISGLTLTADGRLLAHDDSHGRVAEIDYRRGAIVKQFLLGPDVVKADFKGITVANDVVFLLASDGTLYQFREGKNGERVPYTVLDTQLGQACEFEGVAFDPAIQSLLFACKIVKTPALRDSLVIYRWKLQEGLSRADRLSRLTVAQSQVIGAHDWKTVHPSDITIDPKSGNYVLIASKDKALIEITPAGAVVAVHLLPGDHAQPEGVAITKDRILIISDEAGKTPAAVITLYKLP